MLLKRKRSDSEMSSPSYSMSPSPTQSGAIASAPYMSQFGHEITPLHLSSRTRKSVRDNRPSEHQIHGKYPLIRVVPWKQTNSPQKTHSTSSSQPKNNTNNPNPPTPKHQQCPCPPHPNSNPHCTPSGPSPRAQQVAIPAPIPPLSQHLRTARRRIARTAIWC